MLDHLDPMDGEFVHGPDERAIMSHETPVGRELLDAIERCAAAVPPPPVRRVYVPEPHITADKDAEFGLVELEDGAAGLFYAWLGESQRGISERFPEADLAARGPLDLARLFAEPDDGGAFDRARCDQRDQPEPHATCAFRAAGRARLARWPATPAG